MQNLIKQFITVIPFLFHWIIFNGQNYNLNTAFTINEGLPSNHVYDICEDKDGFLWIATNNGVSRFDGKNFLNYSTKDGLPSNDVLQIVKEKNGTIWVNCYKQPPSYFDKKLNRFVSFDSNLQILKISGSFLEILIPKEDGIIFQNELGIIEFKSQKVHKIYSPFSKRIFINANKKYFIKYTNTSQIYTSIISDITEKKERVLGEINFGFQSEFLTNQTVPDRIYNFTKYKINVFQNFTFDSFTYKHDSILVPEPIKWFKINDDNLNLIAQSGTVYIYDKQTLKLKNYVNNNLASNTALIDKNNNLWISTVENGLLYYQVSPIKKLNVNKISNNFLSINVTNDRLLAGNFNGDILDVNKNGISIHSILDENKSLWIRNISNFDSKITSISDAGYAINFSKNIPMSNEKKLNYSLKVATKLNDSILLIGTNTGLLKFNVATNKYSILKSPSQRILAIEKIDNNHFYFVANLGLFKYNIDNQDFEKIFFNENLINDKIDNIALDRNKNLWLSSFKGNIYLLKNNKIVLKFPNTIGLPDNITSLLSVNQKLWIGSKSGIYILNHY